MDLLPETTALLAGQRPAPYERYRPEATLHPAFLAALERAGRSTISCGSAAPVGAECALPGARVTDVAIECSFSHLGRFGAPPSRSRR